MEKAMEIGFVGLGKMGSKMVERLMLKGHRVIGLDRSEEAVDAVAQKGMIPGGSLRELVAGLPQPRIVWIMVPAGPPVDETLAELVPLLQPGDIVIDGGNSNWRESQARAERLAGEKIHFLDCGTSGGVWGLEKGYCLMVGGEAAACDAARPFFEALAPEGGFLYCGPSGAGHFVKMVHNGIEYGMMQAYAEGFELMDRAGLDLDLAAISRLWQNGSVIRSWLLELTERALQDDPKLSGIQGRVADSGEGRWTVQSAVDFGVSAPVITLSLFQRFQSRNDDAFGNRLLSALRAQFGGHAVEKKDHADH